MSISPLTKEEYVKLTEKVCPDFYNTGMDDKDYSGIKLSKSICKNCYNANDIEDNACPEDREKQNYMPYCQHIFLK